MVKNLFLTLFVAVYSLSVTTAVNANQFENFYAQEGTGKVHFSNFSKILFPQVVTVDGQSVPAANQFQFEGDFDKTFLSIQCLSQLYAENSIKAIKLSRDFDLQFPSIDIIFPFHNFW